MPRLFNLCTSFLVFLTKVFHTDYKRISVWINIYIQGIVLFIAATVFFITLLIKTNYPTVLTWLLYLFTVSQMFVVVWACYRYRPPLEKAFDKCYWDLVHLSAKTHISYTSLNILIFIALYLLIIVSDILIVCCLIKNC